LAQEKEAEETYSISLVQTAEVDKKIVDIDDKRVLTESYTVQKGDHLWKIFREKGLERKQNLHKLISMLKRLNTSLTNIDLIHPGQKIIIPLKITPILGMPGQAKKAPVRPISPEELKDLRVENYTVKPGEHLVKIVEALYHIPEDHLYDEYLSLFKTLNPSVDDLDIIIPGQIIRLPIYSPQIVRKPIQPAPPPKPEDKGPKIELHALKDQLGQIFTQLGEEWVGTGEHFIPIKSGGQINLKAESYPIINLSNGKKVIVDLGNDLPEKMARLIESSWEDYRIVHPGKDNYLKTIISAILSVSNYSKIYKLGEPLKLGGDIPLRITGDWIIKPTAGPSNKNGKTFVINLLGDHIPKTPQAIKEFLESFNIKTIDYPPGDDPVDESTDKVEILRAGDNIRSLIEVLLNVTGQSFSSETEISVYGGNQTNFNLTLKADFLINIKGKDAIIDLTGLGPEIISLLSEHQFSVLSFANEKDPSNVVTRILDMLGVQSNSKPHHFMAAKRDKSRNVRLTIPGIIFKGNNGQPIFATHLGIPKEIARFLSNKGYKILSFAVRPD
jgi:LysM repeat protein